MFALATEDRPVLKFRTQVRADRRAPVSAALLGSGLGLGLGAIYLAVLAGHADSARAARMAEAAADGYSGSYLEAQGRGMRLGLERYGFRAGPDAEIVAVRFANDRGAAKAKTRADLECMTDAVYYEARGESSRGQYAVAQVVMNRVKHPAFPKSVCGVVFQGAGRSGCQFSFACDGSMRKGREGEAWREARIVATRALAGVVVADIGRATHFHTTAVSPFWAPQMLRVAQVGTHVFYKFSPYRLRGAPLAPTNGVAMVEKAVLTSGSPGQTAELHIQPAMVEKAIEASLQPMSEPKAKPAVAAQAPTGQAADTAAITAPQSATAASS